MPTRLLKLGISVFFFGITTFRDALFRLAGRTPPGRCITLYYHCVLPQHRTAFARQMDMLLKRNVPVSVGRREPLAPATRYAAVTFDDGFTNVADQAVPELVQRKIPATIFVTSDLLGQDPGWKGYPGRFMSVDELKRAAGGSYFFGLAHTNTSLPAKTESGAGNRRNCDIEGETRANAEP